MTTALEAQQKGEKYGVVWQLDKSTTGCFTCNAQFGMLVRRHHCRHCGYIFCSSCCQHEMPHPRTQAIERACGACAQRQAAATGTAATKRAGLAQQGAALIGVDLHGEQQTPEELGKRFGVHWRLDSEREQCVQCGIEFDTLVRRHHCRHCGEVYCESCCGQKIVHPMTATAERACLGCVEGQQVQQATTVELRSVQFIARAVVVVVAVLCVAIGFVVKSGRAVVLGLIGAVAEGCILAIRFTAIQSGIGFAEALKQLASEYGLPFGQTAETDEGSQASVLLAVPFVLEATLCLICSIGAVTGLDMLAFLLALAFGAATRCSYIDAVPSITSLVQRFSGTNNQYSLVPTGTGLPADNASA